MAANIVIMSNKTNILHTKIHQYDKINIFLTNTKNKNSPKENAITPSPPILLKPTITHNHQHHFNKN